MGKLAMPVMPKRFSLAFWKDGRTLAKVLVAAAIIVGGVGIAFAVAFVMNVLNDAFTVPEAAVGATRRDDALLAPELIDRLRSEQERLRASVEPIPSDLRNPFAPIVVPPPPPPPPEEPSADATGS